MNLSVLRRGTRGRVLAGVAGALFCAALLGAPAAHAQDFAPPVNYDVGGAGSAPQSVAMGDFNEDGSLDLVTANPGTDNVSVLLNTDNGSGTFGSATDWAVGDLPVSVAVADVNADGNLDLLVANAAGNSVSVRLGNGNGTFGSNTAFLLGVGVSVPVSVVVGDFAGDANLDLATANAGSDNVSVLEGNGDGTFDVPPTNFAVGDEPFSLAVGDFNLDGRPDLVTANSNTNDVSVLLATGPGTFAPKADYPASGANLFSVTVGDFDGDNDLDLATANLDSDTVSVLLNNGDGTFGTATTHPVGDAPFTVVAADVGGSAALDLVVTNSAGTTPGPDTVSVLLGNGDSTFGPAQNHATGEQPTGLAVGDLNNDALPDLATANAAGDDVSLLLMVPAPPALTCDNATPTITGTNRADNLAARRATTGSSRSAGPTRSAASAATTSSAPVRATTP